jgi:GNAT superfamily N-acetyltransferase
MAGTFFRRMARRPWQDAAMQLRPITAEDGDAFATLLSQSADSGAFQVSSRFKIDPWRALGAIHGPFDGVVAEEEGVPGLVGCGLVRYLRASYEGAQRDIAVLNTLVVHPARRRKGLAGRLADWRVAHARQRIGDDGVLLAGIQAGNTGSVKTAARWATSRIENRLGVVPTPPKRISPSGRSPYRVRPVAPGDLEPYARRMDEAFSSFNFYPGESAERLAAWLAATPVDVPFHHAWVATDAGGDLLAGLALTENALIKSTRMVRMPTPMRLLNHVVRIIPRDGLMREAWVTRFWTRPGHEAAARRLWEVVRWEWRERASTFMLWSDPLAPLGRLLKPPPWMPHSTGSLVLAGPLDPGRMIYPMM